MGGVGDGKGIGSVEVFGGLVETEDRLEDGSDLLFGGVAIAGDVLFDDGRFVFGEGYVSRDGGGDGYPLSAPEFQHGLDVFPEEGSLDGEVVGMETVDDADGAFVDLSDALVEVGDTLEVQHVHDDDSRGSGFGVEQTVSEDLCAGVDAEDEHYLMR